MSFQIDKWSLTPTDNLSDAERQLIQQFADECGFQFIVTHAQKNDLWGKVTEDTSDFIVSLVRHFYLAIYLL